MRIVRGSAEFLQIEGTPPGGGFASAVVPAGPIRPSELPKVPKVDGEAVGLARLRREYAPKKCELSWNAAAAARGFDAVVPARAFSSSRHWVVAAIGTRPDVLVGNNAGAAIAVLLNTGNGTLASPVATNVSGNFTYINNIQFADLEGDGDLDLLVDVSGDGALYYLWNNGAGSFTTITRDYVANSGVDIKFGDSNNDGTTDLFLFGNKFLTLLGKGSGKFESQKCLLLSNETASSASVFLLDTNGACGAPTSYAQGAKPPLIFAADVTGDGKVDLPNLNYGGTMNVLKNNGAGTFTVLTPFNALSFKQWFDLKDVNEDGTLDIVMPSGTGACVYPGTGTGAFGTCVPFTVSTGASMDAMVLGDVNGDSHLDAVAYGSASLNFWLGNGDGTSNPNFFTYPGGKRPTDLAIADLNSDGWLDVAAPRYDSGSGGVLFGGPLVCTTK